MQYGVAYKVAKIMTVRAVPNGDERDKDIANSIRYAVDNGAKVINMSFGKQFLLKKNWFGKRFNIKDKRRSIGKSCWKRKRRYSRKSLFSY